MAKEFFKDLPNTTTPLTSARINGLLDGEEAMGNIVVDSIRSKNLLSFENWQNTANNITFKSEDGKITITGTYGSQTNFYRSCNLDLKAGTTYVISKNQSNSDQFYPYFILRSGETQVARVNNTDGYITYTPETDIHIDSIMFYINGATGVNCTLYPQVEIGTTPTDYSEYRGLGYVSGSNSNGNYIKYDDGTLICWKDYAITTKIETTWGALYESPTFYVGDLAIPFVGHWDFIVSQQSGPGAMLEVGWSSNSISINIASAARRTTESTYHFTVMAIGRWK